MSLDRDYIVASAFHCLLEIEEQGDDPGCGFRPSELSWFYEADEIYLKLYQNQDWLFDYLNHNFDYINRQAASEIETYMVLNDYFFSMTLYFVVVKAAGKEIREIENPDDHERFYIKTANLILHYGNLTFSHEVLRLLKSLITKKLSADLSHITPEIMVYCIVFLAANDDEEENIKLLKRLNKAFGPTHEDLYLMCRVAYHRMHPQMDIVDFFGRLAPLHLFDLAISEVKEQILFEKIPSILACRLGLEMPIAERLELFMFLQYPLSNSSAGLIYDFLHSAEPSTVVAHIQIFRSFYGLVERGENAEFVNLCTMMVFLYSCRNSYIEIIEALSLEEKDFLKNECGKYLAALRSLDTKAQTQTDFDYHIVCSYMAACFLRDTVSYWAAVKPLLLALRMSKKVWVPPNLKVVVGYLYHKHNRNLASIIVLLFDSPFDMQDEFSIEKELRIEKGLKQLRRDMADGLMELLKPLPEKKYKPGRANNYSEAAQKREGFDPRCTEPDPLYRQAYINAALELRVKGDDYGHTFFAELNKLASKDLSPNVRSAAQEAIRKLDAMPPEGNSYGDYDQRPYIKNALWHIWQAHVFEHEAPYDADAALETKVNLS